MGDLYYNIERLRNFIITKIKDNKIISFPQSVFFTNTPKGNLAKKRFLDSYNNRKNLILLIREEISYNFLINKRLSTKIFLVPDIVFTLGYYNFNITRNNKAIITLRKDKESNLSIDDHFYIKKCLTNLGIEFEELNTCPSTNINLQNEFQSLIKQYLKSKFIITDRLHGMIFAYITATPAIVIPNNNGKVISSYNWIQNCGFIKVLQSNELSKLNDNIKLISSIVINYDTLITRKSFFEQLIISKM